MYDLTTLHFEVSEEDQLRKVGMSKERRVDPQVTVGLLVTASGFPLEVAMFEGNKAETKTLIPVIETFKERHQISDLVVVADAGMLSAANLNALEDAGHRFIVGSRQSHVPYDLGEHSNGTGTTPPTAPPSKPPATWGLGRIGGPGGWSTTTRSNVVSVTTGRSTPRSPRLRRSPPGNAPSPGTGS